MIKYETTIHLLKDHKQKGGKVSIEKLNKFNEKLEEIQKSIKDKNGVRLGEKKEGYLGNNGILSEHHFISEKFRNIGPNETKRSIVAEHVTEEQLKEILNAERKTADKILGSPGGPPGAPPAPGGGPPGGGLMVPCSRWWSPGVLLLQVVVLQVFLLSRWWSSRWWSSRWWSSRWWSSRWWSSRWWSSRWWSSRWGPPGGGPPGGGPPGGGPPGTPSPPATSTSI